MRYTVIWDDEQLDQLAACYNAASDPNAVSAAQHRIDQLLRTSPLMNADPESEGLFSLQVPPLRVIFEVVDADRLVRVVAAKLIPRFGPTRTRRRRMRSMWGIEAAGMPRVY